MAVHNASVSLRVIISRTLAPQAHVLRCQPSGGRRISRSENTVREMLPNLRCLMLAQVSHLSHPLYLPKILAPQLLLLAVAPFSGKNIEPD